MTTTRFGDHNTSFEDCPKCQDLICAVDKRYGGWRWRLFRERRIYEVDKLWENHNYMMTHPYTPDEMPDE